MQNYDTIVEATVCVLQATHYSRSQAHPSPSSTLLTQAISVDLVHSLARMDGHTRGLYLQASPAAPPQQGVLRAR